MEGFLLASVKKKKKMGIRGNNRHNISCSYLAAADVPQVHTAVVWEQQLAVAVDEAEIKPFNNTTTL